MTSLDQFLIEEIKISSQYLFDLIYNKLSHLYPYKPKINKILVNDLSPLEARAKCEYIGEMINIIFDRAYLLNLQRGYPEIPCYIISTHEYIHTILRQNRNKGIMTRVFEIYNKNDEKIFYQLLNYLPFSQKLFEKVDFSNVVHTDGSNVNTIDYLLFRSEEIFVNFLTFLVLKNLELANNKTIDRCLKIYRKEDFEKKSNRRKLEILCYIIGAELSKYGNLQKFYKIIENYIESNDNFLPGWTIKIIHVNEALLKFVKN